MKASYAETGGGMASTIHNLLEDWGEVILHLASGQVAEIHKGDDGEIADDFVSFIDNNGDEHIILYGQVERITTHRAAFEE